jgi:Protein of unknown function (DUF3106)
MGRSYNQEITTTVNKMDVGDHSKSSGAVRMLKRIIGLFGVCLVLLLPAYGRARDGGDNWRRLSPKEKENVQRNYQRWQNLPPKDKEHLREEWDRFKNLPPDQRDNLRRRYDELRQRPGDKR